MLTVECKSLTSATLDYPLFSQRRNTYKLLKLCQIVMNSQELGEYILNMRFEQTKYDNAEVYRRFYSGQERGTNFDGIWQAEINLYRKDNNIIGYTNKGSTIININLCTIPFNDNLIDISYRVGNLIHEYCHLVGLRHAPRWQFWRYWRRKFSAPYRIGNKSRAIAENLLGSGEVEWKDL